MKVLFDYQIFFDQQYGGISRYFANLYKGLNANKDVKAKLGVLFTDNAYLDNRRLPGGLLNGVISKEGRRRKYNKWYSKYLLSQNKFDVFHPTYYNPYFLNSIKKPFVLTVHDMIHELYPQYFDKDPLTSGHKKITIERADHIIAISESTKNDIRKYYQIPDSRITVVHHGYMGVEVSRANDDKMVDGDYLLFVGTREGYKNFERFIKAAQPIIVKHAIKLICAGGGGFTPAELQMLKALGLEHKAEQMSVSDQQLMNLYQHAKAFVYPSLYEGFGLPLLEAFNSNCPVIASNTSSIPEIAGNAVQYFDPADEQSITFAIENVLNDHALQNELRSLGRERLELFSMENCIEKTLKVYQSLV